MQQLNLEQARTSAYGSASGHKLRQATSKVNEIEMQIKLREAEAEHLKLKAGPAYPLSQTLSAPYASHIH